MINALDDALRAWQAALVGRRLYDPDHPSVAEQLDRAQELLAGILRGPQRVQVAALDDRLVCGNETLPSSPELLDGLFGRLRAQGIDSVRFERGLERRELAAVLAALEAAAETSAPLDSTPHVRLEHVRDVTESAPQDMESASDHELTASRLETIWGSIQAERPDFDDPLSRIVGDISVAASSVSGSLLPLASLKSHDEYTFVHTINVAMLASALAEAVGAAGDALRDLTTAALLHDIGKRSIPLSVLNKSGKYTESDIAIMRRHPVAGAAMLCGAPGVPELATVVAYEHHMELEGGGYPTAGPHWRPNVASQIVKIVDIFDALRTNRPYRPALSLEESLAILEDRAGRAFDRPLFDVFVHCVVGRAAA